MKMATEILKIDASWAEEFTKTSEQILMTPTVGVMPKFKHNIMRPTHEGDDIKMC